MNHFISFLSKKVKSIGIGVLFSAFALVLLLNPFSGSAQPYPLIVSIYIPPPYSSNLSSYFSSGSQLVLNITNTSSTTYSIFLAGTAGTLDNSVLVEVRHSHAPNVEPIQIPPGISPLSATQLQSFLDFNSVSYHGITMTQIQNGSLPEGEYRICVTAYDYNTLQPLSDINVSGCSNPIYIRQLDPPVWVTPTCGTTLTVMTPQNIPFTWQMLGVAGNTSNLRYKFRLVEVPENSDPNNVMITTTTPYFESEDLTMSTLLYSATYPPLEAGKNYAVMVTVSDETGQYSFRNNGKSEVCMFTYGSPPASLTLTVVYPASESWMPFNFFPIIVYWDPYNENYHHWHSSFSISGSNGTSDSWVRNLAWDPDPWQAQKTATNFDEMTLEQAKHISVYKTNSETPPHLNYVRGVHYSHTTSVTITQGSSTQVESTTSSGFNFGMSPSTPLVPGNNSTVPAGDITLTFRTADQPSHILPPFAITQAHHGSPTFFDGVVDERWRLEVSRTSDFATIIDTATRRIGENFNLLTLTNESVIAEALYQDMSRSFHYTDPGDYYWRIKWLKNPALAKSTEAYNTSQVFKFTIGTTPTTTTGTTAPPTPSSCVAACDAPVIDDHEKIAVNTITAGTDVQIGRFTMHITDISWITTQADGHGTIQVPYLHAPMKVSFHGLKINAANKVFLGTCVGMYDNTTLMPEN
ncbi:MAG: hypothetical protein NTU44_08950, partial [Bacteroidetes bacterium]|nr:hypothetical protein [Bacteroidota bacterium]